MILKRDKRLQIRGHQRSGNHYLGALVELNLFNGVDYQRHMDPAGHLMPEQIDLDNLNIINVFIYRTFDDTLMSIYNMRERFGLVGPFEHFKNKQIGELFKPGVENSDITIKWFFKPTEKSMVVSNYFGQFKDLGLFEWWWLFCSKWNEQEHRPNVYVCRYEELITPEGRNDIIRDIGKLLGCNISFPIKDITTRVGYYQTGREETWQQKPKDTKK